MATTTKHNIYIYIRVVTKYFYSNYNIYSLSSRPNNSPATRNAKIQYFYQIYLDYEYILRLRIITINTLNFSLRTLFSSIQLLQSQYTLLTSTNYPVTTHLSQVTLYNPVTQQKVVTYVDNYHCFVNYSFSSLYKR